MTYNIADVSAALKFAPDPLYSLGSSAWIWNGCTQCKPRERNISSNELSTACRTNSLPVEIERALFEDEMLQGQVLHRMGLDGLAQSQTAS